MSAIMPLTPEGPAKISKTLHAQFQRRHNAADRTRAMIPSPDVLPVAADITIYRPTGGRPESLLKANIASLPGLWATVRPYVAPSANIAHHRRFVRAFVRSEKHT